MRDVIHEMEEWSAEPTPLAVATVVETWGSAPRGVGAKMVLAADQSAADASKGR